MTERWSRPLKGLRTGDTVERTITVTASKMQAMLIPPIALEQPDGIRIYNGEPTVHDQKTARGDFVYGQRIQTAKYFIEKPGDYTLPPIALQWWNLSKHQLTTSTLKEVRFSAVKNPDLTVELPPAGTTVSPSPTPKASFWNRYRTGLNAGAIGIALAFALFLAGWFLKYVYLRVSAYLALYKASETACFRKLISYAKTRNPKLTYIQLLRWKNHISPERSLGEFIRSQGQKDLADQVEILAMQVYSPEAPGVGDWNSGQFIEQLKEFREQMHKRRSQTSRMRLSSLNPS
jgi:hypothetical protein